jgi:hypothetical protein
MADPKQKSPPNISPEFIDLLAKVLGMLGSDHDGEVIAAGRRAQMLLRSAGLTWFQVLGQPAPAEEPPPWEDPPFDRDEARRMVKTCLEVNAADNGERYEEYELKFLKDIRSQLRRGRKLSEKQMAWLERLYDRLDD